MKIVMVRLDSDLTESLYKAKNQNNHRSTILTA